MEELIKITEKDGMQAVSARDLHGFLESKQDFSNWIANRIKKYGLVENQDFEILHNNFIEQTTRGGHNKIEYALSIDCAKELAMVEGNAKGKQARQYFIACEKKLKQKPLSQLEIIAQSAQILLDQEKRINAVESKVDFIIEKQNNAEMELKELPVSSEKMQERSLKDTCRLLVNRYSSATGIYQSKVWDNVYQKLYYNYHVSIKQCSKIRKSESLLEVAERRGLMDKIYIIISDLLKEKGIAA